MFADGEAFDRRSKTFLKNGCLYYLVSNSSRMLARNRCASFAFLQSR